MSTVPSRSGSTPPAATVPLNNQPVAPPAGGIPTGPRAGNFPYRSSIPTAHHVVHVVHHHPPAPRPPPGPGALIPGGRLLPPIDKAAEDRLGRLQLDQTKLDEEDKTIQERKRKSLYGWEKAHRESEREAYKVELAEKQLINGALMD